MAATRCRFVDGVDVRWVIWGIWMIWSDIFMKSILLIGRRSLFVSGRVVRVMDNLMLLGMR